MIDKINPFIKIPQAQLYPGEVMIPLNPYTNEGYIIKPYYYVTNFGRFFSIASGRLEEKKQDLDNSKYLQIDVETYAGSKKVKCHRGVMASFYPVPNMYELKVDHKFGDKYDNRLWMLRWVTQKRNIQLAAEDGRIGPKSRHINDDAIIFIMQKVKDGLSKEEIVELCEKELSLSIQPQTINEIRVGHGSYKNILANLGLEPILKQERKRLSPKDHDKILELYKKGLESKEIASLVHANVSTVNRTLLKYFGSHKERKNKDKSSLVKQEHTKNISKVDPFVEIPQKYIDQNIELYPINIYASKYFVIRPIYFVSKDGRVFSIGRGNKLKELCQSCNKNTKGYCTVSVVTNKGSQTIKVHRLILATFRPIEGMYELEVDHLNRKRNDNRLENLDWVTHKLNIQRAAEQGAIKNKTPQQIVTDEDIIIINKLAWAGKSDQEIAEYLDLTYYPSMIKKVRLGREPYGTILKALNLNPYKKKKCFFTSKDKEEIYKYIEARRNNYPRHRDIEGTPASVINLYKEAGKKFGGYWETMRDIYNEIKIRKNNDLSLRKE